MNDGPPETITCVECSGVCHRLSHPPPDEGFVPGDVIAYRCADCMERHDVVWEPGALDDPDPGMN